jgi:hypothetical protein
MAARSSASNVPVTSSVRRMEIVMVRMSEISEIRDLPDYASGYGNKRLRPLT